MANIFAGKSSDRSGSRAVGIAILAVVLLAALYVLSGGYDVGADSPHWPVTAKVIQGIRELSVILRSRDIQVPADLDQPGHIIQGAGLYHEMCTGCHLAPGKTDSELRRGLYPKPPDLPKDGIDEPEEAFWVIKHGIKMTAMPAWGRSHTDAQIWDMVAFLKQVKGMDPSHYHALVAQAKPEDEGDHGQEADESGAPHEDAHGH
jgi:mono/diheme cytochrome c family protein